MTDHETQPGITATRQLLRRRRRLHDRHAAGWVSVGRATPQEIDARWTLKRRMKERGLDVEHRYSAETLLAAMSQVDFAETGFVWRMFAMTILMACLP
jgi:hypothetical protein